MLSSVYRKAAIRDPELIRAYEACRVITQRAGGVEYAVSQLMLPALRPAMWALYACGRVTDDLADTGPDDPEGRAARLKRWVADLEDDLRQGTSSDLVRRAVVHTLHQWNLPAAGWHRVLAAHHQDIDGRRFTTWDEWSGYSQAVNALYVMQGALVLNGAGMSVPVRLGHIDLNGWMGTLRNLVAVEGPGAPVPYHLGGVGLRTWQLWLDAFSLTDTLEDLGQDAVQGRVMLPDEALEEFGVRAEDLLAGRCTPAVRTMVDELAVRAERWFTTAAPLSGGLHPALSIGIQTVTALCRARLAGIRRADNPLRRSRPALSRTARVRIMSSARLRAAVAWSLCPVSVGRHEPALPAPSPAAAPPAEPSTAAGLQSSPLRPPRPHPSGARPPKLPADSLPRHVAIIMDGNGRWATDRGLSRTEGHRTGLVTSLTDVVCGALEIGLSHLTVYMLSTENWKRSVDELNVLMELFTGSFAAPEDSADAIAAMDVRIRWAGISAGVPPELAAALTALERDTHTRTGLNLTVCLNYGGRAELTEAAATLALDAVAGHVDPSRVSERTFARYLHQPDLPDVDLLIRTGGEQRTSNFLPWQAAYAELLFTDTLWPDFDRRDLWAALEHYTGRNRRHGAVPLQRPDTTESRPADGPCEKTDDGTAIAAPTSRVTAAEDAVTPATRP
ncbi:polyprenyl diphosphate synthase [Streptomyces sp. NPDC012769]|uniref:polyprenyl diphosphate synthase n=1 Tax=Streptomyces sp. NPDC012769 TaxID=3364848 RepID=UPI00368DDF77